MAHAHSHGSLSYPFADLHVEAGTVRVTLLHDPVIEGVEMALYIDGSASMSEEYEYKMMPAGGHHNAPPAASSGAVAAADDHDDDDDDDHGKGGEKKGWLARLFGWFGGGKADHDGDGDDHDEDGDDHDEDGDHHDGPMERTNEVEQPVREMLQYLATKDRNGKLRVAYWACGKGGRQLEQIGELSAADAPARTFPGPKDAGTGTCLAPALEDFVAYVRPLKAQGCTRACGVFVTDGQIQDQGAVQTLSRKIAEQVSRAELPKVHLVLVGVGEQVSEKQMEEIAHVDHPGAEHLWCHRVAEEMHRMSELVSGLVDETMSVATGGTVYDSQGSVVRRYEGRLPAVLEFRLPPGHRYFSVEIDGRRYEQRLPEA